MIASGIEEEKTPIIGDSFKNTVNISKNPFLQREQETNYVNNAQYSEVSTEPFQNLNFNQPSSPEKNKKAEDLFDIQVMVESLRGNDKPQQEETEEPMENSQCDNIQSSIRMTQKIPTVRKVEQTFLPSLTVLSQAIGQEYPILNIEQCDKLAMFILNEGRSEKRHKMMIALSLNDVI